MKQSSLEEDLIYFGAHGSRVPGDKMSSMCAFVSYSDQISHAYIIGGLFLDGFFPSFWQCHSSASW